MWNANILVFSARITYSEPLEISRLTPERWIRSMVEPEPAAPIILRDGQHLADGSTTFIKEPLFDRCDV